MAQQELILSHRLKRHTPAPKSRTLALLVRAFFYTRSVVYCCSYSCQQVPPMPARWPGNSVQKLARAADGGGFVSDLPVIGPSEPDPNLPSGNIVSDDFASADLESPGFTTFDWGGSANQRFTSLVTMDPATGDPTVVFTSGGASVYNVLTGDPRDWNAFKGSNSMRFAYTAGGDASVFSQQNWKLVSRAEKTLWLRKALRVPTNYIHENVPGSPDTSNNKLLTIWMDDYSYKGDGSTLDLEMVRDGSGGSNLQVKLSTGRFVVVSSVGSPVPFISYPEDQGRWMYLCVKIVAESSEDANDGTIDIWKKWAGEPSWGQIHSSSGLRVRVPAEGPQGFSEGYLMGADNSGYAEDTEFLMDDFNLSTVSLL